MKQFLLLGVLVMLFGNLAAQFNVESRGVVFPPPLPPAFNPGPEQDPPSRSGNNYKIPFDTIRFNNTIGTNGFNIVICEDGVINNGDIAIADNYVDTLIHTLQTVFHYKERFKYINVYRIAKLSNQRGSSYGYGANANIVVDNRYGSQFNAYGVSRLLLPDNLDTLFADVNEFVPKADLVLMLAYDKKYGGSGWNLYDGRKVGSFSIDGQSGYNLGDEVMTHEMQHLMGFAGHSYLADEYEDSLSCSVYDTLPLAYKDSPNYTSDTVHNRKWQYWINAGIPSVGFYDSAGICPGNYRPMPNCIMRSVYIINNFKFYGMPPFCAVCQENSTAYFDSVINPVYYTSPPPPSYTGNYIFQIKVDTPLINTFRKQWLFDDSIIATGVDTLNIDFANVSKTINHTLLFVCTDTSWVIRDTTLRRPWTTTWQLMTQDTVGMGVKSIAENGLNLFPNPVTNQLNGTVQQLYPNTYLQIIAPDGRLILSTTVTQNTFNIPVNNIPQGIYFVVIQNEKQKVVRMVVKE